MLLALDPSSVVMRMFNILGPMPETWGGHYNTIREDDDSWYGRGTHTSPSMISNSLIERNLHDVSEYERRLVLSIMAKRLQV